VSVTIWNRGTYIEELSCVLVSISNADSAAVDSNITTNHEVLGHKGGHAVTFQDHLAVEESTLGNTRVALLGLDDHDRLIFEEVIDENVMNSEIFKSALNDALFEEAVKAEDLYYN
jgi:hypothetical protein